MANLGDRIQEAEGKMKKLSFTLIELLVVVAIIMLLVGMLLPAIGYAKTQAKKARVYAEMTNMKVALLSYHNEYGYWPNTNVWSTMTTMLNGNVNPYTGVGAASGSWESNNNPRAIRFMEFKPDLISTAAEFIDPWGGPYIMLLDHGGLGCIGMIPVTNWRDFSAPGVLSGPEDGMVSDPAVANSNIMSTVAIYSTGPDKVDSDADNITYDDIPNWK